MSLHFVLSLCVTKVEEGADAIQIDPLPRMSKVSE